MDKPAYDECVRLRAEVERLTAENALYSRSPTYDEMAKRITELEGVPEYVDTQGDIEIGILRARIAELEGALEKYADDSLSWDRGHVARAALSQGKK